jgi:signal transduction histidine kinase
MHAAMLIIAFVVGLAGGLALGWRIRKPASAPSREPEESEERTRLAVAAERERIFDDLHDDLGARLLQMVYSAPDAALADQARAALQDLRDVVSRSRGAVGTLDDVLADMHGEVRQRLDAAGISLRWEQPDALPEVALGREHALHLYRIVREAVSNVIRHAQASRLHIRIRLLPGELAVQISDDGDAGGRVAETSGRGVSSMRARAEQLHGAIRWTRGSEGGTKVLLTLPLD